MNQPVDPLLVEEITASLLEWLPQGQWKPEALFKGVAARTGRIPSEELEAAVQLVCDQRTLLTRVLEIVRASKKAPKALQADISRFAQRVIGNAASGLSGWLQDNDVSSRDELRRLAEWAKPNIKSEDAACRKEAEQILGIGLVLLQSWPRVPSLVVLDLIADAFSLPRAEGETDKRPERELEDIIAKSNPRQIVAMSKVYLVLDSLIYTAKAQALQNARLLMEANNKNDGLNNQLQSEQQLSENLSTKISGLENKLENLSRQIQSIKEIYSHDIEKMKIRYRITLGETIRQFTVDASEALELEPPKPDFSKHYLEQLLQKIDGEMTWLNARSE